MDKSVNKLGTVDGKWQRDWIEELEWLTETVELQSKAIKTLMQRIERLERDAFDFDDWDLEVGRDKIGGPLSLD